MHWRKWLGPGRLIASATILLAFVAQALDLLKIVSLDVGDQIILAVVGLVAVDALVERLTLLDKISMDIAAMARTRARVSDFFQRRAELPSLEQQLSNAQTLDVAAVTCLSLTALHGELLLQKARENCRIRLLVINPENEDAVKTASSSIGTLTPEALAREIVASLDALRSKPELASSKSLEIRTYDRPLTHGLFIVDGHKPDGRVRVEIYTHGKRPPEAPCLLIRRTESPFEFEVFWKEFGLIWDHATPYQTVDT